MPFPLLGHLFLCPQTTLDTGRGQPFREFASGHLGRQLTSGIIPHRLLYWPWSGDSASLSAEPCLAGPADSLWSPSARQPSGRGNIMVKVHGYRGIPNVYGKWTSMGLSFPYVIMLQRHLIVVKGRAASPGSSAVLSPQFNLVVPSPPNTRTTGSTGSSCAKYKESPFCRLCSLW